MPRKVRGVLAGAICALGVAAPIATAAPDGLPSLTDLESKNIADASQPGPTNEATLVDLTRWALDHGALAQTYDPESGVNWILMPANGPAQAPEWAPGDVQITVASTDKQVYDAAEDAVLDLATSERGKPYGFSLRIDAESGRLVVDTDAPADVTANLTDRFGDAIAFKQASGIEYQVGPRSSSSAPHWGGARLNLCTAQGRV